jgi:sugar fermentation stimulation protein A
MKITGESIEKSGKKSSNLDITVHKAIVVNRPSKSVKSCYMADICIDNNIELAHSPSLGLCGMIITDTIVFVSKCENDCRKSKYTIELVKSNKTLVGANPLFANKIFSNFIKVLPEFKNYNIEKREIKILNSRLDFLLVNDLKEKFYVEIKNVPLIENNSAIFPDGYKNSKKKCISERAYKHIEDLIELKNKGHRVSLVFIIQRDDPINFKPNYTRDKVYSDKLKEAYNNGVEIYAYKFKWIIKNNIATCKFLERIPVVLP